VGRDTHQEVGAAGRVQCIVQGTHLGLGLVFEVQPDALDAHVATPWGEGGPGADGEKGYTWERRHTHTHTHTQYTDAFENPVDPLS